MEEARAALILVCLPVEADGRVVTRTGGREVTREPIPDTNLAVFSTQNILINIICLPYMASNNTIHVCQAQSDDNNNWKRQWDAWLADLAVVETETAPPLISVRGGSSTGKSPLRHMISSGMPASSSSLIWFLP